MARPLTDEERQVLMDNPELVMFMPRRRGFEPVVFLLVIPVTTMVVLGGALFLTGVASALVNTAPVLSTLVFVAICSLMPFACLRAKVWYDETYGNDRELRELLRRKDLTVHVVRITGVVPQQAEVYVEGEDGSFMFGIASTCHTFLPQEGGQVALIYGENVGMAVRPDPRTQSLLD